MTAQIPPFFRQQYFADDGTPLALGTITVYEAGGTTLATIYTNQAATVPADNPLDLDVNGICEFWLADGSYRFVLKDADGVTTDDGDRDNIVMITPVNPGPATTTTYGTVIIGTGSDVTAQTPGKVLDLSTIPSINISATQVTADEFNPDRIPDLDAAKIVSGTFDPARLPSATTTAQGVVELATDAECIAGTSTTLAVTPHGLAAAIGEATGATGYNIDSSTAWYYPAFSATEGTIYAMRGTTTVPHGTSSVSYPAGVTLTTFSNAVLSGGDADANGQVNMPYVVGGTCDLTGFDVCNPRGSPAVIYWQAEGK